MTTSNLALRLRGIFVAELEDQLRHAATHLQALEQAPGDAEQIRGLFRVMHTLKGASHAAGVPEVETICHEAEAFLASVRDASRAISPEELDRMRRAVDQLRHSLESLQDKPATPAEPGAPESAPVARAESSIRVSPKRLEELLNSSSRLLIATGRVAELTTSIRGTQETAQSITAEWRDLHRRLRPALYSESLGADVATMFHRFEERLRTLAAETSVALTGIDASSRDLDQITGDVAAGVRELRLRPLADAIEGLDTVVREVAAANGKTARLVTDGGDVEADRTVLDQLREALLHLVRNAVDHGIETPAERRAKGKPDGGTIRVSARLLGDRILVTVQDDGAGIDVDTVRRLLRSRGEVAPDDDDVLINRLFGGGISTRARAGTISGRGVGLDAARAAVQRMRGSVRVQSTRGTGTSFTIDAPLALATLRAVLAGISGTLVAVPTAYVERMVRIPLDDVKVSEGRPAILTDGAPIPLVSLGRLLGVTTPPVPTPVVTALVVALDDRRVAFQVDVLRAEQEIVVRPIRAQGTSPTVSYSGVALLATGELAFVLSVPVILDAALRSAGEVLPAQPRAMARSKRVLVVDDSLTTRTLEQSVLEAAGYDVMTAVDGADGWRVLQERGADVVVADVEMPRMDGLELCRAVRASTRFRETPFVLITALETPEDRRRGLDAGADAYLGKSSFEREGLLGVVRELIGE
ncbi:MAG: response regulator [Gemmatimonadaceae bacterium]